MWDGVVKISLDFPVETRSRLLLEPVATSAIVEAVPIVLQWPTLGALDFGWDHPTAAVKIAHDRDAEPGELRGGDVVAGVELPFHPDRCDFGNGRFLSQSAALGFGFHGSAAGWAGDCFE